MEPDLSQGFEIIDFDEITHELPDEFWSSFDTIIVKERSEEEFVPFYWHLRLTDGRNVLYCGTPEEFEDWKRRSLVQ